MGIINFLISFRDTSFNLQNIQLMTQPITQPIKEETITPIDQIDLSGLFVIRYFDGNYSYWSRSNGYVNNINDAFLYKTEAHAQLVADTLLATKPEIIEVKIVPVDGKGIKI
jgi:hypothetical protein